MAWSWWTTDARKYLSRSPNTGRTVIDPRSTDLYARTRLVLPPLMKLVLNTDQPDLGSKPNQLDDPKRTFPVGPGYGRKAPKSGPFRSNSPKPPPAVKRRACQAQTASHAYGIGPSGDRDRMLSEATHSFRWPLFVQRYWRVR